MRFSIGLCLSLAVLLAVDPPLRAVGRYDQFTAKFKQAPDRAAVLAAGYLGGSGTEWFVGGGFQPDGTVVIAGVTLGPKLDFGTVGVAVLGKDSAAPGIWTPKPLIRNGKPELEKDGTPKFAPAAWTDEAATAFVLRLSADMKTVVSASRFPWRSAGVTAAVVDDVGDIYLAGPAGVGIASLGNVREDKVAATDARNGAVQRTCLVKLDAAAANVLWVRSLAGFSGSPTLELVKGGKLRFASQDLRTYDKLGNVERAVVIPGGLDAKTAVHPTDGTYARGGEKNWPTGREPYRDPHLYIHKPDGKILYEFYNWDGPYVGLENLRLVSDSAVRLIRYDDEGNLILYAWSDGGNSVMYREPYDVRTTSKNLGGLGFSAYGANVLSCAYIIKLDGKKWNVVGGTLWLSFLRAQDKPNSIWIDTLGFGGDGSILYTGRGASSLIQTGNAIGGGAEAGPYIAALSRDCSSLRFCSAMPACGKPLVTDSGNWGIVRGKLKGREVALYLSGAIEKEEMYGRTYTAPVENGPQKAYGGGSMDGYFLLLDLSTGK